MNRADLIFPREPARFDREDFHRLLQHAKAIEASDIHIKTMTRIMCRVHGHMVPVTNRRLEDAEVATILQVLYGAANAELEVRTGKALDNAYRLTVDRDTFLRFRWNAHACEVQGAFGIKITLRELPAMPPKLPKDELGEAVVRGLFPDDGLVLICGATGSGKSTLLAGVISYKAEEPEADCNIVTLESPIEFTYDKVLTESCMITQTAVPQNLPSFSKGVENALREDPDIVLVGEARDAATIEAAVLAAQTGHAVYATVHSNTVGTTFLRLTQSLPTEKADSILGSLIDAIRLIICQRLYPSTDGRRVAVRETLVFDRNIRRELLLTATRNIAELPAVADDLVRRHGQTMLAHAEQLVAAGRLDPMYIEVLRADEQFGRQQRESAPAVLPASAPSAAPAAGNTADFTQLLERLAAAEKEIQRLTLLNPAAPSTQDEESFAASAQVEETRPLPIESTPESEEPPVVVDETVVVGAAINAGTQDESTGNFWEAARDRVLAVASSTAEQAGIQAAAGTSEESDHERLGAAAAELIGGVDLATEASLVADADAEPQSLSEAATDSVGDVAVSADIGMGALIAEAIDHVADESAEAGSTAEAEVLPALSEGPVEATIEIVGPITEEVSSTPEVDSDATTPALIEVVEGERRQDAFLDSTHTTEVVEQVDTSDDRADPVPPRAPAVVTVLPTLSGEPKALTERRQVLSEICDALSGRLETEAAEWIQVQMARDFIQSISVPGLPQHMWQHVWSRLKQHLEMTSGTLALRLAGESVFNKHQQLGEVSSTSDSWDLVRRARALAQEPFFMPELSDATT